MEPRRKFKDRIKLPFTYDAEKMLAEVKALEENWYEYYKALPLRAPAHLVDSTIPVPSPSGGYADGSWTEWMNTSNLKNSSYLRTIVEEFSQYTKVNLVRLFFLAPGSVVKEHTDPTLGLEEEKSMIRLTIPIDNNDGVEFFLNDTVDPMKPGECWYLRLTDTHRVINAGTTDRVNLTIDIIPNDKIVEIIKKAES